MCVNYVCTVCAKKRPEHKGKTIPNVSEMGSFSDLKNVFATYKDYNDYLMPCAFDGFV